METAFEKIGVQLPVAAIVVFVVWMFLRHLKDEREFMKQFHVDHLHARNEATQAIRDCTASNVALINAVKEWKPKNH